MPTTLVELIAKKRDGEELRAEDVTRFIESFGKGELADYQMTAWLMAVFFRGMTTAETVALTRAMLGSGSIVDLSRVPGPKVDKHSTGGVGDKVSLCLAPLVAACGVRVPMVSGRGLGHTGGTLDKLEAIPGFRTDLPVADFVRIVGEVGTCMIGQTAEIAPADKRIYALRDVTATVESIPLIVASILSKKLAEGIDGLVLDVKVGRGAFMRDLGRARELAEALVRVGTGAGKRVSALLTDMSRPLGRTIGNACETREAIELLHGRAPDDLKACTLSLGAEMLVVAGVAQGDAPARQALERAIETGDALRILERMIEAQKGDPRVASRPELLEVAPGHAVLAAEDGIVSSVDPLELGLAAVSMGAGRTRADQPIDPAVGIAVDVRPGDAVTKGQPLAHLHVRKASDAERVKDRVAGAFRLGPDAPAEQPLLLGRLGA